MKGKGNPLMETEIQSRPQISRGIESMKKDHEIEALNLGGGRMLTRGLLKRMLPDSCGKQNVIDEEGNMHNHFGFDVYLDSNLFSESTNYTATNTCLCT